MANPSGDPDLEYEVVGALRLKRGRGKTGYQGVYPAKSKVRPFLAQIKNERTGRMQSIGSSKTAQQAAVAYTRAVMDGDGEDMESPAKRKPKGKRATRPRLRLCPAGLCAKYMHVCGQDCRPALQVSLECGCSAER